MLEKIEFISILWQQLTTYLCTNISRVVEQGFSHEFLFDKKSLRTFDGFRTRSKHSKFEHCQIQTFRHISNVELNTANFVTGYVHLF